MCIVILEFGFISVFNFKELYPWSHGCVTGGKCPGGICLGVDIWSRCQEGGQLSGHPTLQSAQLTRHESVYQ